MASAILGPFRRRHVAADCQECHAPGRRRQRQGDAFRGQADVLGRLKERLAFRKAAACGRPFHRPHATKRKPEDGIDAVETAGQIKLLRIGPEGVMEAADLESLGRRFRFEIEQMRDIERATHQGEELLRVRAPAIFHDIQQIEDSLLISHAVTPIHAPRINMV
ncbi:hypothetical protein ABIE76_004386 [Sinorhizobium fredii]